MIKSEVPTAIFIGSLTNKTKAGIIKNPPPAPTTPVSVPTTKPSAAISGILYFIGAVLSISGLLSDIME